MVWTGIAIFYFMCLAFGFLFALIGAIFGELAGHGFEFGHGDADVGGHAPEVSHEVGSHTVEIGGTVAAEMPGASFFNTITIATFVAFFGLAGLMAVWVLRMSAPASLAFALPTGVLIAVGQFALYVKVFVKAQASSEATLSEVLGCEAEVITSIPGDRVGEIAYVIKGSRYTAPATSADGEEIPRGAQVRIVNIRANTLVVRLI
ncbi:MAG: NfeD family protein [Armatimonadetes bacterium]|nr:NfeD family protein [Armatimonadota bacterium]